MTIGIAIEVLKHFVSPIKWLKAMVKESEQIPGTVSSLAFAWVTILVFSLYGVATYRDDAQAAEMRLSSLEEVVSKNTKALQCTSQERRIQAKVREVDTATRLMLRTEDQNEVREIKEQISDLERELKNLEKRYDSACLSGSTV